MNSVLYTFSSDIDAKHHDLIINSNIFKDWFHRSQREFNSPKVHFQQVDIIQRNGQDHVLFIKMKAESYDFSGHRANGITLLRGHAVAIVVMIECDDKLYTLLVCQPRLPVGQARCPEIPAGMLDGQGNFLKTALKELEEETGLIFESVDMIDLLKWAQVPEALMWSSTGLIDEALKLYLVQRKMTRAELDALEGEYRGALHENELIQLKVVDFDAVYTHVQDSKSLLSFLLVEKYIHSQKENS
jgi:ADP-sugar diphosphatase